MNKTFLHNNIKLLLLVCVGLLLSFKVIPAQLNPNNFLIEQQNEAGLNIDNVTEFCFDSNFNENGTEVKKLKQNFCTLSNYIRLLNCERTSAKNFVAKTIFVKSTFIPGNETDLPPPFSFC